MTLQTNSQTIAYQSPLAQHLRDVPAIEMTDVLDSAGIADVSGTPLAKVRSSEITHDVPDAPTSVGDVTVQDGVTWARIRHDTVLAIGALDLSDENDDHLLTVTDITHGRGHFLLVGQDAPQILAKVCGLDFDAGAFPTHHSATSSLAKVRTTVVRTDREGVPVYHLVMGRSLAVYVWDVLIDAMSEFDGKIFKE